MIVVGSADGPGYLLIKDIANRLYFDDIAVLTAITKERTEAAFAKLKADLPHQVHERVESCAFDIKSGESIIDFNGFVKGHEIL